VNVCVCECVCVCVRARACACACACVCVFISVPQYYTNGFTLQSIKTKVTAVLFHT
jgi:hypothetical protein